MKIIYLGSTGCSDSDFSLIKALKLKNVEVCSYFYLTHYNKRSGLFNILELPRQDKIISASEFKELRYLGNVIDLEHTYIINNYHSRRRDWQYWLLGIKTLFHMRGQKADLFHLTWPLKLVEKIYFQLNIPKVMTVHDPIPHSGQMTKKGEKLRIFSFKKANGLVLLSSELLEEFRRTYNIPKEKITINKMGAFNFLRDIPANNPISKTPKHYILFFGQIQPHKGVDVLIEAMKIVHTKAPELSLIIAGKGKPYFDLEDLGRMTYISFINRYIDVQEVVSLLKGCLFAVCPYKDATQSGVVITSFSLDIPLIVTSVGDMPKQIIHEKTGLVVPPNDSISLSDAILELYFDREKLSYFKNNIRKEWYPTMDWNVIAEKYVTFYNHILSKTR